ncbi:glycosyltransferase family 4 protein [Sphingobium sufflavum]|uniref:glycosyltransferase family 4 protein n=1 Tax=Sphingobium sufflavum TaxID=1129547 RepID=UPI001F395C70|nr:glycosyltransferase family 4 protein [Sphingobium sufflavum]MCE7797296.1 glycosyltransferase family 4 protein [Sphingobium sufflavum]
MKIIMADPSLFTGRYDDGLCGGLARAGHAVTLAGRPLRATDAIVPQGYAYAPRFFRFSEALPGGGKAKQGAKAAEYLGSALAGSRALFAGAQVVHWQWLPFAWADAHWLRRLSPRHALVHTVHNAKPFHGDGAKEAMQGSGYFDLLRRFDALIVHGEETRAVLEERGITVPVAIVPHPPMHLARADERMLAAVPPSPRPRILFFGTIKPYKGFDLLVEAALTLWGEGTDFDLAVAGQPFMAIDALVERVRAAGFGNRLILDLGFLTEPRLDAHLRRADIIAFPYRHIDSSGAFLSACHYGAAMITSESGMFARLPEGAATRVTAGDAGALADGLRPLVRSAQAREAGARAALALGATLGNWDEAAALTAVVYDRAIEAAWGREG